MHAIACTTLNIVDCFRKPSFMFNLVNLKVEHGTQSNKLLEVLAIRQKMAVNCFLLFFLLKISNNEYHTVKPKCNRTTRQYDFLWLKFNFTTKFYHENRPKLDRPQLDCLHVYTSCVVSDLECLAFGFIAKQKYAFLHCAREQLKKKV